MAAPYKLTHLYHHHYYYCVYYCVTDCMSLKFPYVGAVFRFCRARVSLGVVSAGEVLTVTLEDNVRLSWELPTEMLTRYTCSASMIFMF